MILLDTNIVSELMRPSPEAVVLTWLAQQPAELLFLSTVSVAEIFYGIKLMPQGKRRLGLESKFTQLLQRGFFARILSFDDHAARLYGEIMAGSRKQGQQMSVPDAQIAATACANGLELATRNVKDFECSGTSLINPFA